MGTRNGLTRAEVGVDCDIPFKKPAAVIYDLWVAADLREQITATVLRALVSVAREQGLDAWIFCKRKDVSLRQSIEDAGFSMRGRIKQSGRRSTDRPRSEREVPLENPRPARDVRSDVTLIES